MKNFLNYIKLFSNRFKFIQGLAVGLSASSILAYAAVTLPHTFTKGTAISAAEVNANFAALKAEVEKMQIGVVALLDSNQTQTCVSTPDYSVDPNDYQTLVWKRDGQTFSEYVVPTTGIYEIKYDIFTGNNMGSSNVLLIDSIIHDTSYPGVIVRSLTQGQVIKTFFSCKTSYVATLATDASKSFLIIKKL